MVYLVHYPIYRILKQKKQANKSQLIDIYKAKSENNVNLVNGRMVELSDPYLSNVLSDKLHHSQLFL